MKQTITESMFIAGFDYVGRSTQFSTAARRALFEFYAELEADTGEEMEYDPVAICCEWAEYTLDELTAEFSECEDADSLDTAAAALADMTTTLAAADDTILVMAF